MSFTPTGVEFQARGLGSYLSSLGKANQAQQALGKSVSGIAPSFAQAQGAATGFGSKLGSLIPSVGGFASALGGVATVAGGIVVANVFGKLVEGVTAFVSVGLDAIDSSQRLEAGLGALLTANNLYERTTQQVSVAVGDFAEEQEKASQKTEDLAFKNETLAAKLDLQKASIQEQRQRIIQLTAQYGENGLATIEAIKKLALMEQQAQGTERQIGKNTESMGKLSTATQEYTTVTKTSFQQVMQFGEAQNLAAKQTQDLLSFVDKLSIISPFESDQVAMVTKFAVGAGLAVDETKRFTAGFLDLAAAVGIGSEELAFASDQLLQVAKVGKITQVDLKQLRRLGIDLEKIIGVEMAMSIEEFNKEAAKGPEIFDKLFSSVASFSEKTFAGSAKKLATSISGLRSTFTDIFRIGAKNMLRPLVEAIGPVASEMLGRLSEIVTGPQLAAIGQLIGARFTSGLQTVQNIFKSFAGGFDDDFSQTGDSISAAFSGVSSVLGQIFGVEFGSQIDTIFRSVETSVLKVSKAFQNFGIKGAAVSILGQLGLDPVTIGDTFTTLGKIADAITTSFDKISRAYKSFGVRGAAVSILGQLGLDPATIGKVLGAVDQIKEALSNLGIKDLMGALGGIGAVGIAGAIIGGLTAIGAALFSLMTPINLIIAGAALLGAAWAGNWGNIRGVTAQVMTFLTETFNQFVALWLTWWPTIQTVLETTWTAIQGVFVGFQNVAATLAPHFQQVVANLTQGLANLGLNWTDVWNAIKQATALTFTAIGIIILGLVSVVGGIVVAISSAAVSITGTWSALMGNVTNIITQITKVVVGFVALVGGLFTGDWSMAWSGFTTTLNGIMDFFGAWSELMVTLITGPLDLILSVITGFARGFIDVFAGIYDALIGNSIIPDLVNGISQWVSQIPQKIAAALRGLIDLASKPFEEFMDFAQEILNPEKWEEIGVGVIEGVVAGIESAKDKVLEVLKQMAQDALAGVMDTLGISSPSTEFEYVGRMMAAGVAKGWDDKKGDIMKAVMDFGDIGHFTKLGLSQTKSEHLKGAFKGAVTALFEQIAAGKAGAAQLEALTKQNAGAWAKFVDEGNIAFDHVVKLIKEGGAELAAEIKKQMMDRLVSMGQGFATFGDFLIERMKGQDEAALSAIQSIGDLTKKLDEQKSKLATLKTELGAIAGKYGESSKEVIEKQKAIAALTAEIEKNEKAMADQNKTLAKEAKTSKTATISMLQQFLAGSGEFFKFTLQSDLVGVNHVMLDRVKAQEKLNQLLKEEEERQKEIAKIEKAKADLAFLQQQLSILQLIKDQGLDPADILGGIQLGLGASMSDLLKVTSSVIQAMVDQINQDLQIASPSKVMAKIGSRVMQGVGQGLEGGKQKLYQAMDNIPILNGSLASPLPMPAMGMAGGGNNFNGPLVSISVGQVNSPADEDRLVQKAVRAVERKLR